MTVDQIRPDAFFLCYVETTRDCNLECPYCMTRTDKPLGPELTGEQIKTKVLDELARARPGAAVAFSGGETLLRPDAVELVAHAADRGLAIFLNTNGLALTDDMLIRLRDVSRGRLVIVLPFNSVEEDPQRWTRDDSADTVMHAAERCEKAGVEHFFLVTVSATTAGSLDRTMKYLKRRQTPVLRAPFVPRGAGNCFPELMLTSDLMKEKVHPALSANELCYISFTPFFADPEFMQQAFGGDGSRIAGLGCQAGRAFAAVSAEGEVTPCVQLLDSPAVCGNVLETDFSKLLNEHPTFVGLRTRDEYQGKCGRCRYKMTCGGCRALATYRNGDIFAEDPSCFFEPESPEDRSELEEMQTRQTKRFIDYIRYTEPWNKLF